MPQAIRTADAAEAAMIHADWGSLNWLAGGAVGNARGLTLGRVVIKAGQANPRHRHPRCEEILYLMVGRLRHTLGDEAFQMQAGDTITVPAGVFHNAVNIGDVDAEMIVAFDSADRDFELENAADAPGRPHRVDDEHKPDETGETERTRFMPLDITGRLSDAPVLRAGFVGCGSHAFRNIYPTLRYLPIELAAVCDIDAARAAAFARQFGALQHYTDHRRMLEAESLDVVFLVTNYDEHGRPRYPALTCDCLAAGCHVWMEKPPAARCADIEMMHDAARKAQRQAAVGFKKAFAPGNRRAQRLIASGAYGRPTLATMQYRQRIPTVEEFAAYERGDQPFGPGTAFLDHLCHPASAMLMLLGMPASVWYARSFSGAGSAVFEYADGPVATLAFNAEASRAGGMERTIVTLDGGYELIVENNLRVTLHRPMHGTYAATGDFYADDVYEGSLTWEPEFSLGTLYNKAEFLLGYYDELADFVAAARDNRLPAVGGRLEQAWQVTRIFEAFMQGPRRTIELPACPWSE